MECFNDQFILIDKYSAIEESFEYYINQFKQKKLDTT